MRALIDLFGESLVGAAGAAVRRLSWTGAQSAGAGLGRVAFRAVAARRRLTLANLEAAFPGRPKAELERWALESWENLGRTAAECLWAEGRPADAVLQHVRYENLELVSRTYAEGGFLIHLGHFANWELAGLAYSALGLPLTVVAKRIKNARLDKRVTEMRQAHGAEILSHKQPFFGCVRALKRGRALAVLMDQSLPRAAVWVPFFGRPVPATPLTAQLAHRTGRPILALRLRRDGTRIVGTFSGPIPPASTPQATVARLTAVIEAWARERPGEWFWFHNRWKRPLPEGETLIREEAAA